jgi:proteasome accessory factor C
VAEPAIPRLTRLLGLVTHLEERGEATFDELAAHFGVSRDTIKDDIDTLWVSGLPGYGMTDLLDFDGFAYDLGIARLTNSLGLRQVRLAPTEAVALMGALSSIIASGAAPAAAEGALEALRTAVAGAAAVTVLPGARVDSTVAETLRTALNGSLAVEVVYVDAQDHRTERVIEPHRLVAIDGVGYVECFCRRAGDTRTLRLDRIERAVVTKERAMATRRPSEGFVLEPQYQAAITVRLVGRWAFEDLPGVSIGGGPDAVTVTFGVANPDVVVARLLAVAPHLERVEPAALRERLGRAAEAVLAAAEDPTR